MSAPRLDHLLKARLADDKKESKGLSTAAVAEVLRQMEDEEAHAAAHAAAQESKGGNLVVAVRARPPEPPGSESMLEFDGNSVTETGAGGERSTFAFDYAGVDDAEYEGAGFVTSDGTLVLEDVLASDGRVVMAEGHIDQETYRLEGLWRVGDRTGQLTGRRAD